MPIVTTDPTERPCAAEVVKTSLETSRLETARAAWAGVVPLARSTLPDPAFTSIWAIVLTSDAVPVTENAPFLNEPTTGFDMATDGLDFAIVKTTAAGASEFAGVAMSLAASFRRYFPSASAKALEPMSIVKVADLAFSALPSPRFALVKVAAAPQARVA